MFLKCSPVILVGALVADALIGSAAKATGDGLYQSASGVEAWSHRRRLRRMADCSSSGGFQPKPECQNSANCLPQCNTATDQAFSDCAPGSTNDQLPEETFLKTVPQRFEPPLIESMSKSGLKAISLLGGIQCNHCRLNLNYPKGIVSRCQPSQQFENWCLRGDNCRLIWS